MKSAMALARLMLAPARGRPTFANRLAQRMLDWKKPRPISLACSRLNWLMEKGVIPKEQAQEFYASHVAGIFRTVRFGVAEAHGRAEMMEFNYFVEQGAITYDSKTGKYAIDFTKMQTAIATPGQGAAGNRGHRRQEPR